MSHTAALSIPVLQPLYSVRETPSGNRRDEIFRRVLDNVFMCGRSGCWLWLGPNSGDGRGGGYPRMSLDGQTVAVHRAMYVTVNGYVPGKKHIDHVCRNRMCVNPSHLELVTHRENCRRRDRANRGKVS